MEFVEIATPDRDSISGDFTSDNCFGIYVYRFTDGMYYVGKSKDVRDRHVQHKHEYAKEEPLRVIERMWWAPVQGDVQQLDFAETQVIAALESKGYSLRNVMKTGRPRGNDVVMVDTGDSWGVPIPWEREKLPKRKSTFLFNEDAAKLDQFERLAKLSEFEHILDILQTYVNATIAAPSDTAGKIWIATALPSTGRGQRLCCVSVQNAETLVIYKDKHWGRERVCGFINVKKPEGGYLPRGIKRRRGSYKSLPNSFRLCFRDLDSMRRALDKDVVLDCCYRANAELMRRGVSMYGRYNNPYVVKAIIDGIIENGCSGLQSASVRS
ncbi:hypothetical protein [Adlercreutzia sp. ZJ138]|uniref:hypothetical protein n=1 Tax=Adlercreutzia sp. ZJ138 TaxID=2709405 RepID=UPI0013ED8414|nr:hypothetical protein [Adlercreutzia sp. ZJ138]